MTSVDSTDHSMRAEAFESFFKKQERLISDYAQVAGITFQRGPGWAIDAEKGQAFYDPKLLLDRGYSETEALFLTLHETEHCRDAKEILSSPGGRKIQETHMALYKEGGRKKVMANVIDDIHDDARVVQAFPNLKDAQRKLVTEVAIAERDLTGKSRHMQLIWALRREAAAPDEECVVSPEVRAAIQRLRAQPVPGKERPFDILAALANLRVDGKSRIMLLKKYIEPIVEELYQQDLEDQENNSPSPQDETPPKEEKDPFEDEYDEFEEKFPKLLDEQQVQKAAERALVREGNDDNAGQRMAEAYAAEHGVLPHEIEDYRNEFNKIEPYIRPISDTIEELIEDRKVPGRKLTKRGEQGVMLIPGMEAQAWMDMRDDKQSKVMLDFEGREVLKPVVGSLRFRFVADLSFSMNGEKQVIQRRVGQLLLESVAEISHQIKENVGQMEHELNVQSQILTFGSPDLTRVVKPLSSELTERQRVDAFKALSIVGGSTPDYLSLETIVKEMDEEAQRDREYAEKLLQGELKEVVIVLTDGASDDAAAVKEQLENLRRKGARVLAIGITSDASSVLETYHPDARLVEDVEQLPEVFRQLIQEVFGDLFIHKRQQID